MNSWVLKCKLYIFPFVANLTVSLDMRTAYKLFQAWKETQESAASAALASFPAAPGGEGVYCEASAFAM